MSLRPPNCNWGHRRAMSVMSYETLVSVLIEITDELDSIPASLSGWNTIHFRSHAHRRQRHIGPSPPFQGMELQLDLQFLELYVDIVTYLHLSRPDGIQ